MHRAPLRSFTLRTACLLGLLAATAPAAPGQCTPAFAAGDGTSGFWASNGARVDAACVWDPDGPGPLTQRFVFAGNFEVAGNVRASRLAVFDPATGGWSELGGGLSTSSAVYALLPLANGDLVVGGWFVSIGGITARGVARWNGTAWNAYGAGLGSGGVRCLVQMPNGDLVAGGDFYTSSAANVARWNGTGWSPLGTGVSNSVNAMVLLPNGELAVGGAFTSAGGAPAAKMARWNGASWRVFPPMGTQSPPADVWTMAVMPNGDVISHDSLGIFRFDGTSWSQLAQPAGSPAIHPAALLPLPNGDLVAAGGYTWQNYLVSRWNGSTWQPLGASFDGSVACVVQLPTGDLLAGGAFAFAGTTRVDGGARWNGTAWSSLATGTTGTVHAIAHASDGSTIVGGDFTALGGVACNHVARRSGATWTPLGNGVDGVVRAAIVLPNGDVVVAGEFQQAAGVVARRIARWNGSTWSALGSGCNGPVAALAGLPNGDVVAGGEFSTAGGVPTNRVARWNGSTWSALGSGVDVRVVALHVDADGSLLVGGEFSVAGGVPASNVARWDGSTWTALAGGVPFAVRALTRTTAGQVVVAGPATGTASQLRVFDGTAWTGIGATNTTNQAIHALAALPDGDVVAAGAFTAIGQAGHGRIARWNGVAWSAVGTGLDATAHALALDAGGQLWVGGEFTLAGAAVSTRTAKLVSPCPATAQATGSGCAGPAGTLALMATSLPWLGSACTLRGSNVPGNALAILLLGMTTQSLPLATLIPVAGANCSLYATPDSALLVAAAAGGTSVPVPIPDSPALVGVTFHAQLLAAELGAAGLQGLLSSNRVSATLGSF